MNNWFMGFMIYGFWRMRKYLWLMIHWFRVRYNYFRLMIYWLGFWMYWRSLNIFRFMVGMWFWTHIDMLGYVWLYRVGRMMFVMFMVMMVMMPRMH